MQALMTSVRDICSSECTSENFYPFSDIQSHRDEIVLSVQVSFSLAQLSEIGFK